MGDVTVLPRDGVWTLEDLAALPDDGLRYELGPTCSLSVGSILAMVR